MRDPFDNPKSIEIPKEYHSFDTGEPFCECLVCNKDLLEPGTNYFIEKAIKQYPNLKAKDVLFEYAICFECAIEMRNSLSKESLQNIDLYFAGKINFMGRWKKFYASANYNIEDWNTKCLISGKDRSELDEYVIYAHCSGDKMLYTMMPYMLDGKETEKVYHILSKKSKDELNGFIDKHLGPPPSIKEILKDSTPLLIF